MLRRSSIGLFLKKQRSGVLTTAIRFWNEQFLERLRGFLPAAFEAIVGSSCAGMAIDRAGIATSVKVWHFVLAVTTDCLTCS